MPKKGDSDDITLPRLPRQYDQTWLRNNSLPGIGWDRYLAHNGAGRQRVCGGVIGAEAGGAAVTAVQ